MTDTHDTSTGRGRRIGLWILTIILAVLFFGAGLMSVTGDPMMVESFATLGLPDWFRILLGIGEIAGAAGLLIRPIAALAALGLAAISAGAIVAHAAVPPLAQGVPALVLLILTLAAAYMRSGDFARTLQRISGRS
ncbi:MAG: DoxX family protein [Alphaproteobacteria bacterium]|nr:DoxX family protein [Alphaproteobacteria bacterium]